MELDLNKLNVEYEKKIKELDDYISNPNNDYLSEEAENIRAEIYKLQDKIDLLQKGKM